LSGIGEIDAAAIHTSCVFACGVLFSLWQWVSSRQGGPKGLEDYLKAKGW
jgi:hypothetical protein